MSGQLADLNEQQREAVTLPPQHALILAGAGSGKTRVLTTRAAWLMEHQGVPAQAILAVTFTNKAAKEMKARLAAMLLLHNSRDMRSMWLGTFHGLCNRFLRTHYQAANLPPLFQILDSADQLALIKRLLKGQGIDPEQMPPRELQYFINGHKEAGRRAHAVAVHDRRTRLRVELFEAYEAQCQRNGCVDFAELLLRCHELVQRNEPILQHYQQRFRHILVDEFQDTNRLQYAWLKLLAKDGHEDGARLFCVGDDDQSIYRFRGAEVGNMRQFEHEFAPCRRICLEQNYRSCSNILEVANAIIRNNSGRLGKNLWTDYGEGEPVRLFEASSDEEEARWLVEEIQALVADGLSRANIVVLYRSNAQSRVLEHQLFALGVPYRVYGGQRFFERQEIKHALAYLHLLVSPDDNLAFARVVNFPPRGIGARSLEALQDTAQADDVSLATAVGRLSGRAGVRLMQFVDLITAMREQTQGLPLADAVDHVLDGSGLREHYRNEKEGQDRLENLAELVNATANFAAERDDSELLPSAQSQGMLAEFLMHAALEAGEHQADAGSEVVQLMTVHAAKGLEFDAVFVSGLEEGLFPHENSLGEPGGEEEERRLMYVALTRARQRLYLSLAQLRRLHGQLRYQPCSRFIEEIPAQMLKRLSPASGRRTSSTLPPRQQNGYAARQLSSQAAATTARGDTTGHGEDFRLGQRVAHSRFGQGVIVAAEGSAANLRLQVCFEEAGTKWLAMSIAKLTPL